MGPGTATIAARAQRLLVLLGQRDGILVAASSRGLRCCLPRFILFFLLFLWHIALEIPMMTYQCSQTESAVK